jgi:hypothetical protein
LKLVAKIIVNVCDPYARENVVNVDAATANVAIRVRAYGVNKSVV